MLRVLYFDIDDVLLNYEDEPKAALVGGVFEAALKTAGVDQLVCERLGEHCPGSDLADPGEASVATLRLWSGSSRKSLQLCTVARDSHGGSFLV
jgi:hypothetical protein